MKNDGVRIHRNGSALESVRVDTEPFPGFPTDCQAQLMAMMTMANGTSIIRETIFENSPAGILSVALNIRCSKRCANPVLPFGSCFEPTPYQIDTATTGALRSSCTSTVRPWRTASRNLPAYGNLVDPSFNGPDHQKIAHTSAAIISHLPT